MNTTRKLPSIPRSCLHAKWRRLLSVAALFLLSQSLAVAAVVSNASVFTYAEANFATLFAGTPAPGQVAYQGHQFSYQYYPTSKNYLAIDDAGEIYVLGAYTGGVLTSVGSVTTYAPTITTWETAQAAGLQIGGSVNRTLTLTHMSDTFPLDLIAGVPYVFEAQGLDTGKGTLPDPRLILRKGDSSGLGTESRDVSTSNRNARIAYTPSISGTYNLEVSGVVDAAAPPANGIGSYILSVTSVGGVGSIPPSGTPFLQVGTTQLIRSGSNGLALGAVNLTSGEAYRFDMVSQVNAGSMRMLDSQQAALTSNTYSPLAFTPPADGTYYLSVYGYPNSLFSVMPTKTAGQPPGGGTGSGLAGTWCTDVSGDQNCWVFDNDTGSTTGSFYQQSINQYSGTLTNTMTWSVDMSAKTLTYRFTWSQLTNSSYDYSQAVNQPAYTFPFSLDATTFTFQNIIFTRK